MTAQTLERQADRKAGHSFIQAARELVPLLRAESAACEQARELTPNVLAALRRRDMLGILASYARGEGAVSITDCVEIVETLSTGDASTGWDVFASMGGNIIAGHLPEATFERIFASREDCAATAVGRLGKAKAVEGGYLVDARWPFLSGSPHASWVGGLCIVHDGDQPRMVGEGQPHVIMPLLRTERVTLLGNWDATGLRATGSQDAEVIGAFVCTDDVVDFMHGCRPGLPLLFSIDENIAAPVVAVAVALGIARNAVDSFRDGMKARTHQSGVAASEAPMPQIALARCEGLLQLARAGVYDTARAIDAELEAGRLPGAEWVRRASLASTAAAEIAIEIVQDLYRAAGAGAVFSGSPLERAFRDIHTVGGHRMLQRENYLVHGRGAFA